MADRALPPIDDATRQLLGGDLVGKHVGDLISEVCLVVDIGCEPADIDSTIHPHDTLWLRLTGPTFRRKKKR